MEGSLDLVFIEATHKRLEQDVAFFLRSSGDSGLDASMQYRSARVTIMIAGFYLESVSNLAFKAFAKEPIQALDDRSDLPLPIRRFRAVYRSVCGGDLPLDTDGIRDVFAIRNNVMAHPAGISREQHLDAGSANWTRGRLDRTLHYRKLRNLAMTYSQFSADNARTVVKEIAQFLQEFHGLLSGKVHDQAVLAPLWPGELLAALA